MKPREVQTTLHLNLLLMKHYIVRQNELSSFDCVHESDFSILQPSKVLEQDVLKWRFVCNLIKVLAL